MNRKVLSVCIPAERSEVEKKGGKAIGLDLLQSIYPALVPPYRVVETDHVALFLNLGFPIDTIIELQVSKENVFRVCSERDGTLSLNGWLRQIRDAVQEERLIGGQIRIACAAFLEVLTSAEFAKRVETSLLRLPELQNNYRIISHYGSKKVSLRSSSPSEDHRSGATAAGKFETVLGISDEPALAQAFLISMASNLKLDELVTAMTTPEASPFPRPYAMIIQEMRPLRYGMVIQSTANENQLTVSLVQGSCDQLMSGRETGLSFLVDLKHQTLTLLSHEWFKIDANTQKQLLALCMKARSVAQMGGYSQFQSEAGIDEHDQSCFLQIRPIKKQAEMAIERVPEAWGGQAQATGQAIVFGNVYGPILDFTGPMTDVQIADLARHQGPPVILYLKSYDKRLDLKQGAIAGIIVEQGSIGDHGATQCAEHSIPLIRVDRPLSDNLRTSKSGVTLVSCMVNTTKQYYGGVFQGNQVENLDALRVAPSAENLKRLDFNLAKFLEIKQEIDRFQLSAGDQHTDVVMDAAAEDAWAEASSEASAGEAVSNVTLNEAVAQRLILLLTDLNTLVLTFVTQHMTLNGYTLETQGALSLQERRDCAGQLKKFFEALDFFCEVNRTLAKMAGRDDDSIADIQMMMRKMQGCVLSGYEPNRDHDKVDLRGINAILQPLITKLHSHFLEVISDLSTKGEPKFSPEFALPIWGSLDGFGPFPKVIFGLNSGLRELQDPECEGEVLPPQNTMTCLAGMRFFTSKMGLHSAVIMEVPVTAESGYVRGQFTMPNEAHNRFKPYHPQSESSNHQYTRIYMVAMALKHLHPSIQFRFDLASGRLAFETELLTRADVKALFNKMFVLFQLFAGDTDTVDTTHFRIHTKETITEEISRLSEQEQILKNPRIHAFDQWMFLITRSLFEVFDKSEDHMFTHANRVGVTYMQVGYGLFRLSGEGVLPSSPEMLLTTLSAQDPVLGDELLAVKDLFGEERLAELLIVILGGLNLKVPEAFDRIAIQRKNDADSRKGLTEWVRVVSQLAAHLRMDPSLTKEVISDLLFRLLLHVTQYPQNTKDPNSPFSCEFYSRLPGSPLKPDELRVILEIYSRLDLYFVLQNEEFSEQIKKSVGGILANFDLLHPLLNRLTMSPYDFQGSLTNCLELSAVPLFSTFAEFLATPLLNEEMLAKFLQSVMSRYRTGEIPNFQNLHATLEKIIPMMRDYFFCDPEDREAIELPKAITRALFPGVKKRTRS